MLGKTRPATRDELFDILQGLQNKIVGGVITKTGGDVLNCMVGFSGIEYELQPANCPHDPGTLDKAADICMNAINKGTVPFKTLIVIKQVNGKKTEHASINRS
ncbi:hypothetical protein GF343_05455 [Candidatus Woesearchaeota archaeon]|nr:hypothetical protein [Candidatus Woesearchaeota archaeon]